MKSTKSLEDCIMFHKITVFSVDTAERQKAYMMGSLKKPRQLTIRNHVSLSPGLGSTVGNIYSM
jgi:hypothetical protein